jgi:hypothetical protein
MALCPHCQVPLTFVGLALFRPFYLTDIFHPAPDFDLYHQIGQYACSVCGTVHLLLDERDHAELQKVTGISKLPEQQPRSSESLISPEPRIPLPWETPEWRDFIKAKPEFRTADLEKVTNEFRKWMEERES